MIDPDSRYASVARKTLTETGPDGRPREVAHLGRRLIPRPEAMQVLGEITVAPEERLDTLTARAGADPAAFWRLADANATIDPAELERPGRRLVLALPGLGGAGGAGGAGTGGGEEG
ncbi:MAG: hypothetical protein RID91_04835 [Azospirillaceae bacterium]